MIYMTKKDNDNQKKKKSDRYAPDYDLVDMCYESDKQRTESGWVFGWGFWLGSGGSQDDWRETQTDHICRGTGGRR